MAKITLNDQTTGYLSTSAINSNNSLIEDHLNNKVFYRDNPTGEPNQLNVPLDLNLNAILNAGTNLNDSGSLIKVGEADGRYINTAGDTMTGALNVREPVDPTEPATKAGLDQEISDRLSLSSTVAGNHTSLQTQINDEESARLALATDVASNHTTATTGISDNATAISNETAARISADDAITSSYTAADASLQDQMTGTTPLTASAFSEVSWHDQEITNSVTIPSNKNAWSFGPTMSVAVGQTVTLGENSNWMIANGQEPETASNHVIYVNSGTDRNVEVDLINLTDPSTRKIIMANSDVNLADIATNTAEITTKQDTLTGAATTIAFTDLPANRVVITTPSGKVAESGSITTTELGYLDGVTSAIQTQLNNQASDISTNSTNISAKANINSPTFTGDPTTRLGPAGDNSALLASTAFVQQEISGLSSGASGPDLNTVTLIWSGTPTTVVDLAALPGGDPGTGLYIIAKTDTAWKMSVYRIEGVGVGSSYQEVGDIQTVKIGATGLVAGNIFDLGSSTQTSSDISQIWKVG